MIIKIALSLLITTLVSTLFGLLFVSNFWIVFSIAFILQILFFYFFNSMYENKLIEKAEIIKLQQYREATKLVMNVECPCSEKNKQPLEIRFDSDMEYVCSKCNKNLKAVADVKTVLITTPIYTDERVR